MPEFHQICPMCNSTDITPDFSNPALAYAGALYEYKCGHCGYVGQFFPEVEDIVEEKKLSDVERRNIVNSDYLKNINWWWRIIGPAGVVAGLAMTIIAPSKYVFFTGLLAVLPTSSAISFASYMEEYLKEHSTIRSFVLMVYIYSVTFAPLLVMYISRM